MSYIHNSLHPAVTLVKLRKLASHMHLSTRGTRMELMARLNRFMAYRCAATVVQRIARRYIQCRSDIIKLRGIADRDMCVNETDVYTWAPLSDIPTHDFFSYTDVNGRVYGFSQETFLAIIRHAISVTYVDEIPIIRNPYTRIPIPFSIIYAFIRLCLATGVKTRHIPPILRTMYLLYQLQQSPAWATEIDYELDINTFMYRWMELSTVEYSQIFHSLMIAMSLCSYKNRLHLCPPNGHLLPAHKPTWDGHEPITEHKKQIHVHNAMTTLICRGITGLDRRMGEIIVIHAIAFLFTPPS